MTNNKVVLIFVFNFFRLFEALNFTLAGKCSCPMKIDPVCGSVSGIHYTFMNQCVLNCTQSTKPEVLYHYDGVCCRLEHCKPFESPVCDQYGRVYSSRCLFNQAQCVELRQKNRHLKLDMNSPNCQCIKQCPSQTSMQQASSPVCDTNGFTHTTLCSFLNAKCIAKMVHNSTLDIDYMGICCENLCSSSYSSLPVCDSDNTTHENLCSFLKFRCERTKRYGKNASIGLKFFGTCKVEANSRHFLNVNTNQI